MGKLVSKRLVEPDMPALLSAAIDRIFAGAALVPAGNVASLLGVSEAKLRRLGDRKQIGFTRKGYSWRYYAREDVEAYLMGKAPAKAVQSKFAANIISLAEVRASLPPIAAPN